MAHQNLTNPPPLPQNPGPIGQNPPPPITILPPVVPVARARSRLDMPALQTRGAPKKFKGSAHDIVKFILHLEKLFIVNNVATDADKVGSMSEYCSHKVVHILEGMPNYTTPNWASLVDDMKSIFDADKDEQRHRPHDLKKLTDSWRKKKIKSMTRWNQYLREFTKIAGWLVYHKLMDEDECARQFWNGMPRNLRTLVENRLLAQNPTRDMSQVFTRAEVTAVVNARFKRGRFDDDIYTSDSESDEDTSESDSESATDSDLDSDADLLPRKKKAKKGKGKEKPRTFKATRERPPTPIPAAPPVPPVPEAPKANAEVGDLVKQLSRMNIEDPDYNYIYYRATSLDPHVAKCVRAPALALKAPPLPPNNFRNNQYVPPNNNQYQAPNRPPADRGCFGCGEPGHGLWDCAKMAEALATGEIRRGDRGIEWANGNMLRRLHTQGETLIAAFNRQRQAAPAPIAQNHLAYASNKIPVDCNQNVGTDEDEILPVFIQATTSDAEIEKIFAVTRSQDKAARPAPYPATRNHPATRTQVKKTNEILESLPMDGPSRQMKHEALDNLPIPAPIPADPIELRVDFSSNDAIMEDVPHSGPERVLKVNQGPPKILKRPGPRQSAVSAHVNPQEVLNSILNAEVKLSAGQIMAISPAISTALIDVLKLKNAPRPATTATVTINEEIEEIEPAIQIEINGKMVTAIVDTGSMLNVVSRPAWRNFMPHAPMDISKHINMGDANGGQSQLRGYVKDVSLNVGPVESKGNFWVGDKAPFDVLLGRPWQRGNFVSIDERLNGTYLVF
ncbi:hypothetical protein K438DRAFT_1652219, partial [Mycena galopus ATCC 62051]